VRIARTAWNLLTAGTLHQDAWILKFSPGLGLLTALTPDLLQARFSGLCGSWPRSRRFLHPWAFVGTNLGGMRQIKLGECVGLIAPGEVPINFVRLDPATW